MCTNSGCALPPEAEQNKLLAEGATCRACGAKGKTVPLETVKVMAVVSLRCLRSQPYRFCRTSHCPVVYFSIDGMHVLTIDQVRERVYQKEPNEKDVPVCYCFHYSVGDVQNATLAEQESIIADIRAGIAAGQCACELRNPQGSCCLGNVSRIITR